MYIVVNHQGWSTKNVALAVIFQKYYSSDVFSLSFSKLKFVKNERFICPATKNEK